MYDKVAERKQIFAIVVAFTLVGVAGCSSGGEDTAGPATGDLEVSATTAGEDIDANGYVLKLSTGSERTITANGSSKFDDLPEGSYEVELTDIAVNCSVDGQNPRTVSVSAGGTARTSFPVNCVSNVGSIEVTAATQGPDPDPDGYTIVLDGTISSTVTTNGPAGEGEGASAEPVIFEDVPVGQHQIELRDMTANCSVDGSNPRTVNVSFNTAAVVLFSVTCVPSVGDVEMTATTTGSNIDPDGYDVTVNGTTEGHIDANGSLILSDLKAGTHEVGLTDLASNCSVVGDNSRPVDVEFGATTEVSWAVSCTAQLGDLEVTASTTGEDPDADGYSVTVDGSLTQAVATNGTVTFPNLSQGDHSVELGDVANNCSVSGANPRPVTVTSGSVVATTFDVTCTSVTGAVEVTATTTGSDFDPDGYLVSVDEGSPQGIGVNETLRIENLPVGDHKIELTDLAVNCTAGGSNPRTVTVPSGGTATTTFAVTCVPLIGDLEVTASTTGSDIDPDGYTVTLNGSLAQSVSSNGSVSFDNLDVGSYSVELSDLAANCSVTGDNPRMVDVTFSTTAGTTFDVTCESLTGALEVTATTTGSDLDPDGYLVSVNGGAPQSIGVNETLRIESLAVGDHEVELTDLAVNCTATGSNPRKVTVPSGATATTTFVVSCVQLIGDLEVTTSTTGLDIDPDGYTVTLDGSLTQGVSSNGSVNFGNLDVGSHTVELSDIAVNCSVTGDNPRSVDVPFSATATTTFDVTCDALTGDLTVNVTSDGVDIDPDGYKLTLDDVTEVNVSANDQVVFQDLPAGDHKLDLSGLAENCGVFTGDNPRMVTVTGINDQTTFEVHCWGPLRGKIAFESDRDGNLDVWVMNTDGTGKTNLSNHPARDRQPDVSPDGLRIAFMSNRDGGNDVHVMTADGVGVVNLTDGGGSNFGPVWSPDGTQVAYTRRSGGFTDVFVINADGTGKTNLTSNTTTSNDEQPTWSPDGTQIAFQSDRDGDFEIYVMNADGSNPTNISNDMGVDFAPAWSPDGMQILFSADRGGARGDMFIMNTDGTDQKQLTVDPAPDFEGSWSPDGDKIAFTSQRDGNDEIYIMTFDAMGNVIGLTRVTVDAALDGSTSWSPK